MSMPNQNADRLEKFQSITTEVFALTLGLGAFSLAIIPRTSMLEVAQAIGAFAIAFFYIAMIWIIHSRFFEKYPLYDNIFLAFNFVILFLVAISPFLMQGFSVSPDFADPMSILYALDIMGIYVILGFLHQRYIWQNKKDNDLVIHLKQWTGLPCTFYSPPAENYLLLGNPDPVKPIEIWEVFGGRTIAMDDIDAEQRLWLVTAPDQIQDLQREQIQQISVDRSMLTENRIGGIDVCLYGRAN